MANNPFANKILYGDQVLIDLTQDTVVADKLAAGLTAHDSSGNSIVGTARQLIIEPIVYDYVPGYVSNGAWKYENSTNNHTDIYEVEAGRRYLISLGGTVGTRFRSAVIDTNPYGTNNSYNGTTVSNKTNPSAYDYAVFTSSIDGFLVVTKDNVSVAGYKSYLVDVTVE